MEIANILIQVGVIVATIFGAIKYMASQNSKREDRILTHHETQQKQMMEFYAKKNDHLERISSDFTATLRKNTEILSTLTSEIKLLRQSHDRN